MPAELDPCRALGTHGIPPVQDDAHLTPTLAGLASSPRHLRLPCVSLPLLLVLSYLWYDTYMHMVTVA